MASAVDSRLAYARPSAVATASRLPSANSAHDGLAGGCCQQTTGAFPSPYPAACRSTVTGSATGPGPTDPARGGARPMQSTRRSPGRCAQAASGRADRPPAGIRDRRSAGARQPPVRPLFPRRRRHGADPAQVPASGPVRCRRAVAARAFEQEPQSGRPGLRRGCVRRGCRSDLYQDRICTHRQGKPVGAGGFQQRAAQSRRRQPHVEAGARFADAVPSARAIVNLPVP